MLHTSRMIEKEIFRIKKGVIHTNNADIEIPFYFGIVSLDRGLIQIELYIEESYDLVKLIRDKDIPYWNFEYKLKCKTEDDDDEIQIDKLRFTLNSPKLSKVKMVSYGKLEHFQKQDPDDYSETHIPLIHYIILEGLNIEFSNFTEKIISRAGRKVEDINNMDRDHTATNLVLNRYPYSQSYYLDKNGEDIIVEFTRDSSNHLSYETFLSFKDDYVTALNFLNGADVKVRKECYGFYYSTDKVDAEKNVLYSFPTVTNKNYNNYVPINDGFNWGENILSKFFLFNFDKFVEWNKKVDLNAIIFYLNGSEQTKSLDEKVFIQIIAFERLTTAYAEHLGEKESFMPNHKDFVEVKKDLYDILEKHKDKFGESYFSARSKIGNLNQVKRFSTTEKMYKIISDFNIPISSEIEQLVAIARHKTVHRGDIGKGREALTTHFLLNELIREIILRMSEYDGKRNSRILLK